MIGRVMLKRELIAALTRRYKKLKVKDVDLMVRLVFEAMTSALAGGQDIELRGLGSFRLRTYSPRKARNPGTGEQVELGTRRGVLFRLGQGMRDRLNTLDEPE
ncbi:MAG: HU family DNA-binding protein [Pseudomonadota bacterium]